jgi:hypothetical protein
MGRVHLDPSRRSGQLRLLSDLVGKGKGKAKGPSREELVAHLVRCMEQTGLTIEAADVPGYRRPGHVKPGLPRSRFRPDVVARDGRRTIFGMAKSEGEASRAYVRDQLETFTRKCRMLVICIPQEGADQAVDALFLNSDMVRRNKVRLLRHPDTKWQEVLKTPQPTRRPADHVSVRVIVEHH